jgi:2-dehydropantoate 2-reductase
LWFVELFFLQSLSSTLSRLPASAILSDDMSVEKTSRYVIYGAGAIGASIAALLCRAGSRVICVARPAYAEALRKGIEIREEESVSSVSVEAVTKTSQISVESDDVAFITTKSQATETAVAELHEHYDESLPVVCMQNGVRNEEIAARKFKRVYAGLVFLSAVQIEPSVITMPPGRSVAIGRFPTGLDDKAYQICAELRDAGFDALPSAHVMSMKWGKLVANLNNATTTITGYWLERAMSDPEMRKLMVQVREEGLRVLDAAGIAVEPPANEPSQIRIREMTEKLKDLPKRPYDPAAPGEGGQTFSSMWQDLHLGRKSNESEFLNGEIVELGKRYDVRTPYNSTVMDVVNRMFAERLEPGLYSPTELHDFIRSRTK